MPKLNKLFYYILILSLGSCSTLGLNTTSHLDSCKATYKHRYVGDINFDRTDKGTKKLGKSVFITFAEAPPEFGKIVPCLIKKEANLYESSEIMSISIYVEDIDSLDTYLLDRITGYLTVMELKYDSDRGAMVGPVQVIFPIDHILKSFPDKYGVIAGKEGKRTPVIMTIKDEVGIMSLDQYKAFKKYLVNDKLSTEQ